MINKINDYSYSLDFFGKECKKNYHNQCSGQWEGFGFQIICKCQCHREKVLGRDERLSNTCYSPLRSDEEYAHN